MAAREKTRTRHLGFAPSCSPAGAGAGAGAARCPSTPPRALAAAIALVAMTAIAGCGKSGPPSKAEYVTRANAICIDERQRMTSIALQRESLVQAIDESNQARAQTAAKLEKLQKPAASAAVSEWLAARATALAAARAVSANRRDRAANRAYLRAAARAEALAKALGVTSCVGFASS
jgi:hypothetical protein